MYLMYKLEQFTGFLRSLSNLSCRLEEKGDIVVAGRNTYERCVDEVRKEL